MVGVRIRDGEKGSVDVERKNEEVNMRRKVEGQGWRVLFVVLEVKIIHKISRKTSECVISSE